jgi:nicotinamidase-related amidase
MPKRALIVIDVQNEYFDGALPISDPPPAISLANIGRAMDAATGAGVPRRSSTRGLTPGSCTPRSSGARETS